MPRNRLSPGHFAPVRARPEPAAAAHCRRGDSRAIFRPPRSVAASPTSPKPCRNRRRRWRYCCTSTRRDSPMRPASRSCSCSPGSWLVAGFLLEELDGDGIAVCHAGRMIDGIQRGLFHLRLGRFLSSRAPAGGDAHRNRTKQHLVFETHFFILQRVLSVCIAAASRRPLVFATRRVLRTRRTVSSVCALTQSIVMRRNGRCVQRLKS